MSKKSKYIQQQELSKFKNQIFIYSLIFLTIKLVIIYRISNYNLGLVNGKAWLGADGENYLNGVNALVKDGIFSKDGVLNYWPAGYPITIYALTFFSKSSALTLLSIFQSAIFSISIFYFISEVQKTKIKAFAFFIFLLISLNPTLTLASLCVGYETLAASGFLIISALLMYDLRVRTKKSLIISLLFSSLTFSYVCFIQPRFFVAAILVIPIWSVVRNGLKNSMFIVVVGMILVLLLPVTLVLRNHQATGQNTISTNLGNTMNIGAGDSTGGYVPNPPGVKCPIASPSDSELVKCVLKWYIEHPQKSLILFFNKSIFFWSPWFGPEANGTMARNPWLTFHPLKEIQKSQSGFNLIYGVVGKTISWLWIVAGIVLLVIGFRFLYLQGNELRILGFIAMSVVASSWVVTLFSIGDHRFRLPIMGMSLFLQGVGLQSLSKRRRRAMVIAKVLR